MSKSFSSTLTPLKGLLLRPHFLLFSLSVIFSQIAFNMLSVVLIVLTYNITHSNFAVSILVMTFLIPQVFLSFFGGIVADAKNKKSILLFGNLTRAIVMVIFFFVKDTLAFIYMFQLIIAIFTQFYVPAEAPVIPHLVRKSQLLAANAIFGVCLFGSILIGYVAAGPAMRIFGNSGVLLFIGVLFAIAYFCVLFMPKVGGASRKLRTEKTAAANTIHLVRLTIMEFRDVLRILSEKRHVASSLLFLALSQVIILVLATIVPDYAQETLHIPAEDISMVVFAPAAAGMIIASLFIGSRFSKASKEGIITTGIFLSCVALFLLGIIDLQDHVGLLILSIGITLLAGIANACIFVPAQTIVQTHVSHKSLAKVFGLLYLVVGIAAFVPIILTGVFADVLGTRTVLIGTGTFLLLLGLGKQFLFKEQVAVQ